MSPWPPGLGLSIHLNAYAMPKPPGSALVWSRPCGLIYPGGEGRGVVDVEEVVVTPHRDHCLRGVVAL